MSILKKLYNKSKEEKGFTLVELIVVLVIIAILAAILVPSLLKYIDTAKQKQATIDARTAYLGVQTAVAEEYAEGGDLDEGTPQTLTRGATGNVTPSTNHEVAARAVDYVEGIQKEFTCKFTVASSKGAINFFEYTSTKDGVIVELSGDALKVKNQP